MLNPPYVSNKQANQTRNITSLTGVEMLPQDASNKYTQLWLLGYIVWLANAVNTYLNDACLLKCGYIF